MNGRITDGEGKASGFIDAISELLTEQVGFRPYPGTLNLKGVTSLAELQAQRHPLPGDDHCDGLVSRQCRVAGIRSAVIRPLVPDYPADKTELIAPVNLRSVLGVESGGDVSLTSADVCASEPALVSEGIEQFDGVVFDLDGTLVDLTVEWEQVHARLEALLDPYLDGALTSYSRPEVFELAREHGLYDRLDDIVTEAEVDGATSAEPLPPLRLLETLDCQVGLCTANAERAATVALERFDMRDAVDVIVARDTTAEHKPDPATLQTCLDELDVPAGNALYAGNEAEDENLAVAVGTSYAHVEQL
ncbi:DUF120 domain-containing protein [Haloarchaeobius sp. TZWSO28]|uniref:DUF120 domain-containing protein n=1 Tax=Haloarchaeobius sp. TZWSO28 TaxID=3446119 RepID=UPI003EBE4526